MKKKIILLHSSSDLYGASKILLTSVTFLTNKFDVSVILSEEGPLAEALRKENIKVFIIRLGILRRKYFNPLGLINRFKVMKNASKKIRELVINNNIDIVYSNTAGVLIGAYVARQCKLKHVWHIHEIITTPFWFVQLIGYIVNAFSSKVIVVSEAVKVQWSKYIDKEKIEVIYNGIDYSPYDKHPSSLRSEISATDSNVIVGMIGRVHFWKGQEYFLKIASKIVTKNKNVRFVMVGDAFPGYESLYEKLKNIIQAENLEDYVSDLGYRTDIPNLLQGFDIFVSPSILPDPLPTVILEAMASSKPVVATGHGGACEMVLDGVSGRLIPWDNEDKAAETIEELIEKEDTRRLFGGNGRKRVLDNFSLAKYEEKLVDLLDNL
jgi:glycosyltransferase involved in cell wall biosynthesis